MRFPLIARVAAVVGIAIALLIPLASIKDKIAERRDRAEEVQKAYAAQTSGPQALAGPFLALTCEETYVEEHVVHLKNGKPLTVREKRQRACPTGLFLPKNLTVEGALPVEQRYRGIYPLRLYRAQLGLSGEFELPPLPDSSDEITREWKAAYLVVAISDVRGIKSAPRFRVGPISTGFAPGALDSGIASGLHAPLGSYAELEQAGSLAFNFALELAGTVRFELAPLGERNDIRLASSWPHPSFIGGYPPDRRQVTSGAFSALWQLTHYATGGRDFWLGMARQDKLFENARLLGVSMVEPVNVYSLSYRATEYGFLFVLLTFAAFAMLEIAWGVRLHPVQYGLVGLALAVFFLLLIALSEHVAFLPAYIASASACVALMTYYLRHPLGTRPRTIAFGALFAALYGALYVLLKSEDHALLLGSLLVFGVLATVMALTRRLDWAALSGRLRQPLADPA